MTYNNHLEVTVQRLKPSRDIQPVSEFRANAAKFIDQVRATKEPVIITQHGRGAAVLVDIDSYEELVESVGLMRDLLESAEESRQGRTYAHADVKAELRAMFPR